MADCRICGCPGWLFRLGDAGLCRGCEELAWLDVEQRLQLLRESQARADATLNPHSRIQSLDIAIKNLEALADYERKGVQAPGLSAAEALRDSRQALEEEVLRTAKEELDQTLERLRLEDDGAAKLKIIENFRLRLHEYRDRAGGEEAFSALEGMLAATSAGIRLNAILATARREEEDGRPENAARHYKRALNVLAAAGLSKKEMRERRDWIQEQLRQVQPEETQAEVQ